MTTNNRSISRFSVLVLGALLMGLPATAALGAEPATAPEAQAMAQHAREQADHYRALGGVGYKTGSVQRAEADAAKYSALADQLATPTVAAPVRSPEAKHYAKLAQQYRAMGGVAYKSGLVQWAETQQLKYETAPVSTMPMTYVAGPACAATASKPVVRTLACAR
jgi:hypothetical protein